MRTEWQGNVQLAELVAAGTCILFSKRGQTQIGIRVDEQHTSGQGTKGYVSLSSGYDGPNKQPAYFELSTLSSTRLVYALPDAGLALPVIRECVHPGRYGLDWGPGALAQTGNKIFLAVAHGQGTSFIDLTDGILNKDWAPPDDSIWFSAWAVVRRYGNESKIVFDFALSSNTMSSSG
jgi:hypothetical protein